MSFTVIQRFDKIVHSFFDATKKFPFPAFPPQRHENKLSFFPNILQNELKSAKLLQNHFHLNMKICCFGKLVFDISLKKT